ncbi:MAG: cytosine permease [Thaumarchaeota archaeon]|nr:cytosine permease [Nitrososphaerota archaeon]
MSDKPVAVEKVGIEHVTEEQRHGSPGRNFTLWFAANLTVADYVIGVLTTAVFHLPLSQAIPIFLFGNLLGGLFLGFAAAMGPSLGFPQMLSSRASFGRFGNYLPGGLNWVSTVGWFTVNTILATEAVQVLYPGANFAVVAVLLVVVQVLIAVYGHDFIHLFEKVMAVVLGLLFLWLFYLATPDLGPAASVGSPAGIGVLATVFAIVFSYLMSWAPYASDYSRYIPSGASRRKILVLALAGGAASSFAIEAIGGIVGVLSPPHALPSGGLNYFGALNSFAGSSGALAMLTIILGALAANALNLYTNALSALVLDVKARRWVTVVAGGVVGLALTIVFGSDFEPFFENFLLALAYWITPWLGVILVDFYLARRTSVESTLGAPRIDGPALGVYLVSLLVSVPFMVPLLSYSFPVGSLASVFGGADLSYFVSFAVAVALTYAVRRRSLRV